jgi:hypothetical protein
VYVLRALAELDEAESWRSIQLPAAMSGAPPLGRTGGRRGAWRSAAAALGAAVVLAAVAVVSVELAREHGPAVDSSACERSPEAEMASAWSPALRANLLQRLAGGQHLDDWLYELDGFAGRWVRDYRSACTSPHGTQIVAKRACLLGQRDRVSGLLAQLLTLPRSIELPIIPSEEMPRVEACDGESPVAPATLPTDPVRRAKILALHGKLWSPPEQTPNLLAEMPGLLAEAEALGWDRILVEAHYVFGSTHSCAAISRSRTRGMIATVPRGPPTVRSPSGAASSTTWQARGRGDRRRVARHPRGRRHASISGSVQRRERPRALPRPRAPHGQRAPFVPAGGLRRGRGDHRRRR